MSDLPDPVLSDGRTSSGNIHFPLFSEAPHRWTEALAAKEEKVSGMKFDAGKPMAGLMVSDFANALLAVAEVTTFGAKKYAPHSWATVPNARERYNDALYRHLFLAAAGEAQDQESALLHAAHVAWNALALLELEIRKADPAHSSTPSGGTSGGKASTRCFVCGKPIGPQATTGACSSQCWSTYKQREGL